MNQETNQPNILIVDDTKANLQLLGEMLRRCGYRVRPAPSGALALKAAAGEIPDLVLLDINMPEMDGYEVCRRFKEDPNLKDVPIIFISAMSETGDKLKAFKSGGVDYVPKPFKLEEVEARVATHLQIRRLQADLERKNLLLEQNIKRLRELEDLRDDLVHMIAHDMRSPLTGIIGVLELVELKGTDAMDKKLVDLLRKAGTQSRALASMINDLLDVSRLEQGKMPLDLEACDLRHIGRQAAESANVLHERVVLDLSDESLPVQCDRDVMLRVFNNLLGNSLKFSPDDKPVRLRMFAGDGTVHATVIDAGSGIPPELHDKIFEKFGRAEQGNRNQTFSIGLGLAFCRMAVEAHGGKIGVESEIGKGSRFWIKLDTGGPARETTPDRPQSSE